MDPDVVVRAQGGDHDAFASIAAQSGRRLNALAYGILRDRTLAEDAVQQSLISIWRDLRTLRDPARFEAWSYRLLVRACYAESRRQRRPLPEFLGDRRGQTTTTDPSDAVADRDQIDRGLERLSLEQRAVVVLHFYFDLSQERVAETLGVRPGTVRSRLHRAMQTMRAALEADARQPTAPAISTPVPDLPDLPGRAGKAAE